MPDLVTILRAAPSLRPFSCREAVGADFELFDGFEGKLLDSAADGVVFVVDAVDGGVGVTAAGAVDGVYGVTILGGIVAVDHLDAGGEDGEVCDVAAVEGKVDDFARSDGGGAVGLFGVDELVGGGDFNRGADGSGLEGEVCGQGGSNEELDVFDLGGTESGGLTFDVVGAAGRRSKRNSPDLPVVTVRVAPVPVLVAVMVALGRAAPVASVTTPMMLPVAVAWG